MSVYFFIAIAVGLILLVLSRGGKPDGSSVRMPKLYMIIGFVALISSVVLGAMIILNGESVLGAVICSALFILAGVLLLASYFNKFISYDETGFTERNFWRKTRTFTYGEVTKIERKATGDVSIFCGTYKFSIDQYAVGKDAFVGKIEAWKIQHEAN